MKTVECDDSGMERELILNEMVLHMNKKARMAEELRDILKESEMSEK
jgi:hypothetical protein